MLRFLADENFNNDVLRGVWRRHPTVDIARVQDVGLAGAPDPEVLAWAALERRVLLTHDVSTMTKYACDRVKEGQSMPGVFEASRSIPISVVIDDILLLAECSEDGEWEGQIHYLPL